MYTITEILKNIVEVLAILIAAFVAFMVKWQFVPVIYLNIESEWLDKPNGKLKLILTVENKSNVKAVKKLFRLQILKYDLDNWHTLSEWVPFEMDEILEHEIPDYPFKDPVDVWKTTVEIYPGAISSLDYVCTCEKGKLIHVGLFFESDTQTTFKKIWHYQETWCTTKFIYNAY